MSEDEERRPMGKGGVQAISTAELTRFLIVTDDVVIEALRWHSLDGISVSKLTAVLTLVLGRRVDYYALKQTLARLMVDGVVVQAEHRSGWRVFRLSPQAVQR